MSGHDGNRLFISPFVMPANTHDFDTLKKSLLFGRDGLRYQFFYFYQLCIGHKETENSWELELKVIRALRNESAFWSNRLLRLERQGDGLEGFIGTPPAEEEAKLTFSDGFAFWSGWGINHAECDHEIIYLTISAVLQNLREKMSIADSSDSLRSHVYQHAVISPENFVRYNDSILQSCIWRAANSTELDYRRSDELSHAMSRIILRVIDDLKSNKSQVAIDLLMGVATGKIRLSKKVLDGLLLEAFSKFHENAGVLALLTYIREEHIQKPN